MDPSNVESILLIGISYSSSPSSFSASSIPPPPPSPLPSASSSLPTSSFEDDLIAGGTLIAIGTLGILLHLIEMVSMYQLVSKVIGFRFFLVLSCADICLLLIFGIFPGWIILSKHPGFLTSWQRQLHTWADTCWFSMCYMNVFIALTRFACVVFPLQFRRLRRQSTCWLICASIWAFAMAQSWWMNSLPWFVILWYDPSTYGFSCDFGAYISSGTRDLYLAVNLVVIGAYLAIYISTAAMIFFKRNLRFQFFSTIFGRQNTNSSCSSKSPTMPTNSSSQKTSLSTEDGPPNGGGYYHQHQIIHQMKMQKQPPMPNKPSKKVIMVMRTISVIRGNSNNNNGTQNDVGINSSASTSTSNISHHLEVRLVLPCCVNSLIFIIAQLIIIHGGIGTGKWAGFSVMLIFCIQSIAPPILRFTFSEVLREQALLILGLKNASKRRFPFLSAVASLISRQH